MAEEYPLLFDEANLENLRIMVEHGQPVSHIGMLQRDLSIYGCTIRVGSVGSVCTHPEYRMQGYAGRMLDDCIHKLERDGADIMLVSGNRTLYQRAGCAPVGLVYHVNIRDGDRDRLRAEGIEVCSEADLRDVIRLHQGESVRFIRPYDDVEKLLSVTGDLPSLGWEQTLLIIQWYEHPMAYVVVRSTEKEGHRTGRIVEYAGSREVLIRSLGVLLDRYGVKQLRISIPFYDRALIHGLESRGFGYEVGTMGGHTLRVIHFERLMERMRSYMEERLGRKAAARLVFFERGGRFIFRWGDEERRVGDRLTLTRMLFGASGGETRGHIKGLQAVLREILPLPLPLPGLNYV